MTLLADAQHPACRNSTLKRKCQQMELAQQRCAPATQDFQSAAASLTACPCRAAAEDDSSVSSLVSDETGDTPKSVLAEPKKRGAASTVVSVRAPRLRPSSLVGCKALTRLPIRRPTEHTESFAFMRSLCELEDSLGDVLPAGLCGLAAFPDF